MMIVDGVVGFAVVGFDVVLGFAVVFAVVEFTAVVMVFRVFDCLRTDVVNTPKRST